MTISERVEFWFGEYNIKPSAAEKCDGCGEVQPIRLIELQGHQFLCRNCSNPQPGPLQMPKMVRLTV